MPSPLPSAPIFGSVLCGTDNGPSGVAARRQAAWLAGADGALTHVPTAALTRHGWDALEELCARHDLIVLGADPAAHHVVEHARIPVLQARWCPGGLDVTDNILVAVSDAGDSLGAADLAGRIAARHRGSVSLVVAPGRDPSLARGVAASGRILLRATGAAPRVLGDLAPPELNVPATAMDIGATLLMMGIPAGTAGRRLAVDLARRSGCSALTVPAHAPVLRRFARSRSGAVLVPA